MIRVAKQPEPADFDAKVRQKGANFLTTTPKPTQKEWTTHAYWRASLPDLYERYRHVCAYSCHWIPRDSGASVEHFIPRTIDPTRAYEWDNFRLVALRLNSIRSDTDDILDPFEIEDSWFELSFPSMMIFPNSTLSNELQAKIQRTIDVLRLVDDDRNVQARFDWVKAYCDGEITLAGLHKRAPFIACELTRQGISLADLKKMLYP